MEASCLQLFSFMSPTRNCHVRTRRCYVPVQYLATRPSEHYVTSYHHGFGFGIVHGSTDTKPLYACYHFSSHRLTAFALNWTFVIGWSWSLSIDLGSRFMNGIIHRFWTLDISYFGPRLILSRARLLQSALLSGHRSELLLAAHYCGIVFWYRGSMGTRWQHTSPANNLHAGKDGADGSKKVKHIRQTHVRRKQH